MINFKHVFLLLLMFALGACAISKQENERFEKSTTNQAIVGDITSLTGTISAENLEYFEGRAIQKLIDFYDYLNILGHEDFNLAIKEEVRSSAQQLFFDPQNEIEPFSAKQQIQIPKAINTLLNENIGERAIPELSILNVEIIEKLHLEDKLYFVGKMEFDVKNEEASIIISKEASFSLRKTEKKFGEESMSVWEVFLDDIF